MRSRRTVAMVAAGLSAVPAAVALPAVVPEKSQAASGGLDSVEMAVVNRVNAVRAQAGVPPVRPSGALARVASRHSSAQLRRGMLSHGSLGPRVRRYTNARTVGETIAWIGGGGGKAAKIVSMWMQSPPHRRQILSATYKRVGVGARSGRVRGRRGLMVTANFASGG